MNWKNFFGAMSIVFVKWGVIDTTKDFIIETKDRALKVISKK